MKYAPLVEYCVKRLVKDPDQVQVDEVEDRGTALVRVQVAPDDAGMVIGRNGRLISAIRQIVNAAASKNNEKAYVKVLTD